MTYLEVVGTRIRPNLSIKTSRAMVMDTKISSGLVVDTPMIPRVVDTRISPEGVDTLMNPDLVDTRTIQGMMDKRLIPDVMVSSQSGDGYFPIGIYCILL